MRVRLCAGGIGGDVQFQAVGWGGGAELGGGVSGAGVGEEDRGEFRDVRVGGARGGER